MADVFISYKSQRRAAAEHLAEILTDYGYSVWWDYALISGGDFSAQIERELRSAKVVVVLWCSLSIASEWVREEAALAKRLDRVIPTRIEMVELPLGFSLSQTLDLTEWDGNPKNALLDRLLRDIGRLTGRPPHADLGGLERTERAWRRYGAPSLREFALIDVPERRTSLPTSARLSEVRSKARNSTNRGKLVATGVIAVALAIVAAWGNWYPMRPSPAQTADSKIDTVIRTNQFSPPEVDVCADARAQWRLLDGSGSASQFRVYLDQTDASCIQER